MNVRILLIEIEAQAARVPVGRTEQRPCIIGEHQYRVIERRRRYEHPVAVLTLRSWGQDLDGHELDSQRQRGEEHGAGEEPPEVALLDIR